MKRPVVEGNRWRLDCILKRKAVSELQLLPLCTAIPVAAGSCCGPSHVEIVATMILVHCCGEVTLGKGFSLMCFSG